MSFYCVVNVRLSLTHTNEEQNNIRNDIFHDMLQDTNMITVTQIDYANWQIVRREYDDIYSVCIRLMDQLSLHNQTCVMGIGIGSISTNESKDSRRMDGEAFILARESIELATLNQKNYSKNIPTKKCNIHLLISSTLDPKHELASMVNQLIQNNEVLRSKITSKQWETIRLYEQYGSYDKLIANDPNMKKGTLSDKMNKSNYWMMKKNEKLVEEILVKLSQR